MGWAPVQVHTHYDAEDQVTGYTVVETEAEWDEQQRSRMLALSAYEHATCPGCGLHPVNADPETNHYTLESRRCPVCAAEDLHGRREGDQRRRQDEGQYGKTPPPAAPRAGDGMHTYRRRLTDAEVARAQTQGRRMVPHRREG